MRPVLAIALFAMGVVAVCVLSALSMSGNLSMPSSSSRFDELDSLSTSSSSSSSSDLSSAQSQLEEVRKTMVKIQKQAGSKHARSATEAQAAAKDRALEKKLDHFAKSRQERAKETESKAQSQKEHIEEINGDLTRLEMSIHEATVSIKRLASDSQKEIHSAPVWKKEIADTTQRLLELAGEHQFLAEKVAALSKAEAPHVKAYTRDQQDLKTMELQVQQLKAQAKLYSAQASVIADSLSRHLKALKLDQKETSNLKKESDNLPPRSSVKFATPKFVSLAAQAKAIYTKAGTMIQKVEDDNSAALREKQELLALEQKMAGEDQKAATIDLSAAKMSSEVSTQKYLAAHFKESIGKAKKRLAANEAAVKRLKTRLAQAKTSLKNVDPTVAKDRESLKEEEKMLLTDQTNIDTDKAEVLNTQQEVDALEKSLKQDLAGAKKDLKLAAGAAMAARVHERESSRLAKEAAEDDERAKKLSAELAVSDKKVREAKDLDIAAAKAAEELAQIDKDD